MTEVSEKATSEEKPLLVSFILLKCERKNCDDTFWVKDRLANWLRTYAVR